MIYYNNQCHLFTNCMAKLTATNYTPDMEETLWMFAVKINGTANVVRSYVRSWEDVRPGIWTRRSRRYSVTIDATNI